MKEVYKESLLHVWYFVVVVDERLFEFVSFENIINCNPRSCFEASQRIYLADDSSLSILFWRLMCFV